MKNATSKPEFAEGGRAAATPQAELRQIRKTDRTLAGFVRCLEIIEQSGIFQYKQSRGRISRKWLRRSEQGKGCRGCVGTLLAWFFDARDPDYPKKYEFQAGRDALADHLDISDLNKRLRDLVNKKDDRYIPAFGGYQWRRRPSKVFKELRKQFPAK